MTTNRKPKARHPCGTASDAQGGVVGLLLSCTLACGIATPKDATMESYAHKPSNASDLERYRVPLDARRDELRHPNGFLDFAQVKLGDRVLEMGGGDGYTAMYVANRVGPSGSVLALNPPQWRGFIRPYVEARVANGPLPGVEWIERPFDDPIPPRAAPLDLVVCVLIYHDMLDMDVDRVAMNRKLFDAMGPNGRFLVIDHAARAQDGGSVGSSLHRIGRQLVIDEVTAAGFVLADESDALRMPEDSRTTLAWSDPQPATDRFMLLFKRPA